MARSAEIVGRDPVGRSTEIVGRSAVEAPLVEHGVESNPEEKSAQTREAIASSMAGNVQFMSLTVILARLDGR